MASSLVYFEARPATISDQFRYCQERNFQDRSAFTRIPSTVVDATKDSLSSAPNYAWSEKSAMDKIKDGAADFSEKAKNAADMKEPRKATMSE